MTIRPRTWAVAAAVVALLSGAGVTGLVARASATGTAKTKDISLYASVTYKGKGTALVIGGVGDHGKLVTVNKSGKPSEDGNYETLDLQHGSITLNESATIGTLLSGYHSYKATCTGYTHGSGNAPIVRGTGSYAHITGTITNTITIVYQLPRRPSGACNQEANKPRGYYGSITGSGTITLK